VAECRDNAIDVVADTTIDVREANHRHPKPLGAGARRGLLRSHLAPTIDVHGTDFGRFGDQGHVFHIPIDFSTTRNNHPRPGHGAKRHSKEVLGPADVRGDAVGWVPLAVDHTGDGCEVNDPIWNLIEVNLFPDIAPAPGAFWEGEVKPRDLVPLQDQLAGDATTYEPSRAGDENLHSAPQSTEEVRLSYPLQAAISGTDWVATKTNTYTV